MESSPNVRFDSTTVQTPPVHALLQSTQFGSSLHSTILSVSQVPLRDQCIGCFAQYNCQSVIKLADEAARAYRTVASRPWQQSETETTSSGSEPLVELSIFLGLRNGSLAAAAAWNNGNLGKIAVAPFRWPRQRVDAGNDLNVLHVMDYTTRIDLSWKTATECEITIAAEQERQIFAPESFFRKLEAALNGISVSSTNPLKSLTLSEDPTSDSRFRLDPSVRQRLRASIAALKSRMTKGDCYLANITERIEIPEDLRANSFAEFLRRWGSRPSRFGWFIRSVELGIESYSPERFFRIKGSEIITEPIKGTTPCGTATEQQSAAAQLWQSRKERCEQHLVSDLLRNDFAAVCVPGSISVPSPLEIRFCSGLAQMTSVVRGQLRPGVFLKEILGAVLPAGSVTGAPKKSACEILEKLEASPRGLYCGVIADMRSPDSVEATLLIRSLFSENGSTYACAGAGITTLSIPDEEVQEIEAKLRSFLERSLG
jgi:anthranilate/para-aminobenzoate synthase component I